MPASTGYSAGTGSSVDPYEEARRKLAQRERLFSATGDYNTQAAEARQNFLRPEVQGANRYSMLGVQAPPEVAGYDGGDPLVSGRPLTSIEKLQRSFEGEDIAAERQRIAQASAGGGYATTGASAGQRPFVGGYSMNPRPVVGNPPQAGSYGDPRSMDRAAGKPSAGQRGAAGGHDEEGIMQAVGLVPTNFSSDGRSNPIREYVRPEEAQIRKQRNAELVKEEYGRRFGPDPRLQSKYANLSEAAVVEYATEGTLAPSEDPNNPHGSDEANDQALIVELRSRRAKDGSLAFSDPDIEVILRSVRAERVKRRKAGTGPTVINAPAFGTP